MTDAHESTEAPAPAPVASDPYWVGAIVVAILWALLAIIVAIVLLTTTKAESYGGDAYTGIQNAVVVAVHGIAWLLIGSGALGLIVALRPHAGMTKTPPTS